MTRDIDPCAFCNHPRMHHSEKHDSVWCNVCRDPCSFVFHVRNELADADHHLYDTSCCHE